MRALVLGALVVLLTPFSTHSQIRTPVRPGGPITITPPIVITPNLTNPDTFNLSGPTLPSFSTNLPTVIYQDPQRRELRAVPVPPARLVPAPEASGGGDDCETRCRSVCGSDYYCMRACKTGCTD